MALLVNEEKLRNIFEQIYQKGWDHGFINQVLMDPDAVFEPYIEDCKKVVDNPDTS